jgi:hypothetical protein
LLHSRRPLLIRRSVLGLAAVAAAVALFPSAGAAFLRPAAGAVPVRLLRMPPARSPVFVRRPAGALLHRHLLMPPPLSVDARMLLPVCLLPIALLFCHDILLSYLCLLLPLFIYLISIFA